MTTTKYLRPLLPAALAILAACGPELERASTIEAPREEPEAQLFTDVFDTNRGRLELTYELVDGTMLFEGDIILRHDTTFAAGRDIPTYKWPNNTIPYTIASSVPNQQRILDAIAHWESNTSIRFVQRTSQIAYVSFVTDSVGCSSEVGRQWNRSQEIRLASWCTAGNVEHEIGHAVGFWHEQSRADRDSHIIVQWSNIYASWQPQYTVYSDGEDYGLYDIGSIMQYPGTNTTSAIDNTMPTMTRTDGSLFAAQRDGLSDFDRAAVEEMYSQGFGRAIAIADFNGDGFKDAAIGAPHRVPALNYQLAGTVRIYRGSAAGLVFSQELSADLFSGVLALTHDSFGYALAAGDFNGDGFADLAIGAPGKNPTGTTDPSQDASGMIFIFNGRSGTMIAAQSMSQTGLGTNEGGDKFGTSLAAGDFNGDGKADLAVGAPGEAPNGLNVHSGLVFAYRGTSTGLTAWRSIDQAGLGTNEAGDSFGWSLAAGDFNGDGRADLAVGAPHENVNGTYSGHVFSFHGSTTGLVAGVSVSESALVTPANEDYFGASLAVGDFNGDGRADLAVGAPGRAVNGFVAAGEVFVYRGSSTGLVARSALVQSGLLANERTDAFGAALAAGDVDGDGLAELAVGAPGEGPNGFSTGSGYVYTYRGTATGFSAWTGLDQTGLGTNESGDRFGAALGIGDFNRDGKGDLVVGAPGETPPSNVQSGWAFSFRGAATGLSAWIAFGP